MDPHKDSQADSGGDKDGNRNKPIAAAPQEYKPRIDESKASALPGAATPKIGSTISPQSQPSPDTMPSGTPPIGDTAPAGGAPSPRPAHGVHSKNSKKKKRWIVALIITLAVLLAGGGVALAYSAYYLPNRPDNVLKTALANSFVSDKAPQSASFAGEFSFSNEEEGVPPIGGSFEGVSAQDGSFDLSVDIDALVTTLNIDVRSVDGSNLFVRAGGLAGLPELLASGDKKAAQFYASLVEGIDNQWFEINESLINQATDGSLTPQSTELQKIADLYTDHPFLVVDEALPDEQINDTDSYHYSVVVDKPQLLAFARAAKDADIKGFEITDDQMQRLENAVEDVDFDDYPVEVWIAKDTKRFTRLAFAATQDGSEFNMELTFTGYNEPVEIERPEDAKSILEVLGNFFGSGEPALPLETEEGLPAGIPL